MGMVAASLSPIVCAQLLCLSSVQMAENWLYVLIGEILNIIHHQWLFWNAVVLSLINDGITHEDQQIF